MSAIMSKKHADTDGTSRDSFIQAVIELEKVINDGGYAAVHTQNDRPLLLMWSSNEMIEASNKIASALVSDACHLVSLFRGMLYAMVAIDACDHIVPLAYAWAPSENTVHWSVFLE